MPNLGFTYISPEVGELDKIDDVATDGLSGTANSLSYRLAVIERHLHSSGRWFGAAVTPTATHFADRIGVAAEKPVAFVVDSGNKTWGDWVQLLGSTDTPTITGKTHFDPHEFVISAAERAGVYFIQIGRGASGAAALSAGTYTELVLDATDKAGGAIVNCQTGRAPAGSLIWCRVMTPAFDTGTLSFYLGLHEYEG